MRRVLPQDIVPLKEYDGLHALWRRRIVDLKSRRRVAVGRFVTLVFENFDTVHFQIQEMLRVERIGEPEKVRFEIDTYNELLPSAGELSATMFIELDSAEERRRLLPKLVGIEKSVWLKWRDGELARARRIESFVPEEVERPDYASSVYFLRFSIDPAKLADFLAGEDPLWLVIDHPHYGASERISPEVAAELKRDLSSGSLEQTAS